MQIGVYKHYKGGHYQVIGIAQHSETDEQMVVYVSLTDKPGPKMFVRPAPMFNEMVDAGCDGGLDHVCGPGCEWKVPRFEYIGEEIPNTPERGR